MWKALSESLIEIKGAAARASTASATLPKLECSACTKCLCVACGAQLAAGDSQHADTCTLRFHYAAALGIEALRQIQLHVGVGRKELKPTVAGSGDEAAKKAARKAKRAAKALRGRGGRGGRGGLGRGRGGYIPSSAAYATPFAALPVLPEAAVPPTPPAKPAVVSKEPWTCTACTFVNAAGTTMCGVCGTEFREEIVTKAKADAELPMPWNCEICTFLNEVNKSVCMVCEQPRVSAVTSAEGEAPTPAPAPETAPQAAPETTTPAAVPASTPVEAILVSTLLAAVPTEAVDQPSTAEAAPAQITETVVVAEDKEIAEALAAVEAGQQAALSLMHQELMQMELGMDEAGLDGVDEPDYYNASRT
jgi:hypothetical protein